jgi:peptide/nickel transport system substrate-binding protein
VRLTVEKKSWLPFPIPECVIATAAYGSELSPQVQVLRLFRDKLVMSTFAGSQFMKAFNAWYYSFSPSVASVVSKSPSLASVVRALIYPLLGILQVSAAAYGLFGFNSELGVTIAGLLASSLIGLVYDMPWITALLVADKKKRRFEMKLRYLTPFAGAWVACMIMIGIAGLLLSPPLMVVATGAVVLLTMGLTATVAATLIARKLV